MDYGIFNVRTDVNACDCTRGCTNTERESALKVDSGRKIPCHTRESNLSQQLASLTLYQMSYIPNLSMYLTVWNTVSGDIFTVCFFLELFCLFVFLKESCTASRMISVYRINDFNRLYL